MLDREQIWSIYISTRNVFPKVVLVGCPEKVVPLTMPFSMIPYYVLMKYGNSILQSIDSTLAYNVSGIISAGNSFFNTILKKKTSTNLIRQAC
jgi:hypothetical protein